MGPRTGTKVRRRRRGDETARKVVDAELLTQAKERVIGARDGDFVVDRKPGPEQPAGKGRKAVLRNERALDQNDNVKPVIAFASAKDRVKKKRRQQMKTAVSKRPREKAQVYDVWDDDARDTKDVDSVVDPEWWKIKASKPVSVSTSTRKPALRMVQTPDDALSVNPLHEPHQDRLGELVATEIAKRREADQIDKYLNPKSSPELGQESGIKNDDTMSAGPVDDEPHTENRHVPTEKLTRAQRNKISRQKEAKRETSRLAREGAATQDISRIDEVIDEIETAPPGKKATAKLRGFVKKRKIGGRLVPEMPVSTLLTEELADTLRGATLQNNAVADQFIALQTAGLVEPRVKRRRSKKLRVIRKARIAY